jgi:hypothetical protein
MFAQVQHEYYPGIRSCTQLPGGLGDRRAGLGLTQGRRDLFGGEEAFRRLVVFPRLFG